MSKTLVTLALLLLALGFSTGCATALGLGQTTCEALVGGSQADTLCEEFERWKSETAEDAD